MKSPLRFFDRRWRCYRQVFGSGSGRIVLTDLAGFCGVMTTPPLTATPYAVGRADGAREVFLHIAEQLTLTPDGVAALARDYGRDPDDTLNDLTDTDHG